MLLFKHVFFSPRILCTLQCAQWSQAHNVVRNVNRTRCSQS